MNLNKGLIGTRSFSIVVIGIYFVTIPNAFPMAKKPPQAPIRQEIVTPEPKPLYTLRDCYELSLKRSETIAIRKEAIEETEAEFLKAGGEIFGDVDFVMTDFRQDAPRQPVFTSSSTSSDVGRSSTAYDRRERKFVITQPLFQGFKSIAALGAAGSLRKQRKQERIRAEQLLFFDVARAFYDVIEQKRNVEIIEEIRKSFLERIDSVLGLRIVETAEPPDSILKLLKAREDARRNKDFAHSDEIRKEIQKQGWFVKDGRPGEPSQLKKKKRVWEN